MQQASKVALMKELDGGKFGFYSYDFFRPPDVITDWESLVLRYVWSPDKPIKTVADIFTDQQNFHRRHFTIGTNPWSHHVVGHQGRGSRSDLLLPL